MSKFLLKLTPEWSLRVGLGVMYFYSGIDILRHPTAWFWALRPVFRFLPISVQSTLTVPATMTKFLMAQGVAELLFAFILLAWFLPNKCTQWVAGLTVLEMAGILMIIPIDAVTFRDFGLLGAGLALFLLLNGNSNFIKTKPPAEQSSSFPKPEIKLGGEPLVQTFDQFIGNK